MINQFNKEIMKGFFNEKKYFKRNEKNYLLH